MASYLFESDSESDSVPDIALTQSEEEGVILEDLVVNSEEEQVPSKSVQSDDLASNDGIQLLNTVNEV